MVAELVSYGEVTKKSQFSMLYKATLHTHTRNHHVCHHSDALIFTIHIMPEETISQRMHLSPGYTYMHTVLVYLHKALPPREAPITALTTVCPSAYTPPVYEPAEQSVTDNHAGRPLRMSAPDNRSGCLRRTTTPDVCAGQPLRMSAPDTGVLSNRPEDRPRGKLPTRRICLSPVSAISRLRLPD